MLRTVDANLLWYGQHRTGRVAALPHARRAVLLRPRDATLQWRHWHGSCVSPFCLVVFGVTTFVLSRLVGVTTFVLSRLVGVTTFVLSRLSGSCTVLSRHD